MWVGVGGGVRAYSCVYTRLCMCLCVCSNSLYTKATAAHLIHANKTALTLRWYRHIITFIQLKQHVPYDNYTLRYPICYYT